MRYSSFLLPIACVAAWAPPALVQAAPDASEMFLDVYMNVQQAEKLENTGNTKAALAKYRYAGSLLDQIYQKDPTWESHIVAYRRKKTAEAIDKLQKRIALEDAANAATAATALAPSDPTATGVLAGPITPAGGADVLDQATQQIRAQMTALQRQLNFALEQLEGVRQERTRLRHQLDAVLSQDSSGTGGETSAEITIAELRAEVARARADAAESQAQLARAREQESTLEAEIAATQGGPDAAARIAELQQALDDARADREVAEEQGAILARRVQSLSATPNISEEIQKAEARAKEIEAENARIAEQLVAAQKQVETLETTHKQAVEERDTALAREKELIEKLGGTEKELEARASKLAEAEQKLIAAAQEKAQLTEQVTAVATERDKAIADLEAATQGSAEVEKLVEQNRDLLQKLEEARAQANPDREQEIKELQTKIAETEAKLLETESAYEKSRTLVTELETQLKSDGARLIGDPEEQKKLTEENELLRGIVMRELEGQARRDQARKAIVDELTRLQIRSKAINDQVQVLAEPAQPLTERERALFKGPQLEIVDNESDAVSITIIAPQVNTEDGEISTVVKPDAAVSKNAASSGKLTDAALKRLNLSGELQQLAREGREKFDKGDFAGAEKDFATLAEKAPDNIFALTNLGTARYRSGKLSQAAETFQQVIKIAPKDAFSHATLGIIYYKQNNFDGAVESLTRSLSINPKNATAHNYLGVAAAQKGWKDAARKEIETAIQIDPQYADAHFNLAVVLATAQPPEKDTARKHYDRALALGSEPDKALEELIR